MGSRQSLILLAAHSELAGDIINRINHFDWEAETWLWVKLQGSWLGLGFLVKEMRGTESSAQAMGRRRVC